LAAAPQKGGKITSKIPPFCYAGLMNSLKLPFLAKLNFGPQDAAALRHLGKCQGRQQLYVKQRPETLEKLRTVAMVESTDASNRIEGITAPKARVEALVQQTTEPKNRSEQEIAGYRRALDLIHDGSTDIPIKANIVRQLHKAMYSYMSEDGGEWKITDNEIVEKDSEGNITRVRFKAVSSVATPQAMEDLFNNYHQALENKYDPLVAVPLAILDFLCIHPFTDGNGRVGRLLTLLMLYHADYQVGRYISLERLVDDSRKSYYQTLEASSQGWHEGKHDAMPWITYFWGILTRAYKEFEERVGDVDAGRGSKSKRVRDAVNRKMSTFKVVEIERDCPDISRDTIRAVLREMKKEGLVKAEGRGPGARWRIL